jgi:hypothetical protein
MRQAVQQGRVLSELLDSPQHRSLGIHVHGRIIPAAPAGAARPGRRPAQPAVVFDTISHLQ